MNSIKFIVTTFLAFLLPYLINAEGVKQLTPDSTYRTCLSLQPGNAAGQSCFGLETCDADHKLYVHIDHPGEKIFMGFGWSEMVPGNLITVNMKLNGVPVYGPVNIIPGSLGHIGYFSEAYAGPNVLDASGYRPIGFAPATSGDYEIYFDTPSYPGSNILLSLFDVSVIDTNISPLMATDGRLWAKNWTFKSFNVAFPKNAFRGTMNVYTEDSVVTSVFFNSMQGDYFDLSCNSNGCYPPPIPWDSSCKSATGKHGYQQYKIFVNNPDSICYPTGQTGSIDESSISVIPACDGSFNIFFSSGKSGRVKAVFDVNPASGIQPEDVVLIDSADIGLNALYWNGLNGMQQPLPGGTQIMMTLCLISGLTNLPVYDVEKQLKGFVITQVRPPGSSIASYWNDTLLASLGGQRQLAGCYSYDTIGCHGWDGNYNHIGIGSYNTVNTWWYASGITTNPIILTVQKKPDAPIGIVGPTTFCQSAVNSYTLMPNPLPGAGANSYEWVLADDATSNVLLTMPNQGATATIPFSPYPPGNMHLKVRGMNTLCGYGPFGPAASGEGIQLHVNPAPQVINSDTSMTICSGQEITINLQSSLPATTWAYTATATSGSVSGYSGGTVNPIVQTLFNTGIEADSVVYRVVPFALSCQGDTADFSVAVNIGDPVDVSIAGSVNNVCAGTAVTFTAAPTNPGANPSYQWKVNSSDSGLNAPIFTYVPANGDVVQCVLTSSNTVCTSNNPATSNSITMAVNPILPVSVAVSPSANPVCAGTQVTFTAIPVNGGTSPQYQWKVNGSIGGTNSPNFSFVPTNGDLVSCILLSSETCTSTNPASSIQYPVSVLPLLPVSVSFIASSNPFCSGNPVTFTATPVNGGSNPFYQWKVNGGNAGTNSPSFTYSPANGDQVSCLLNSSESCITGNPALSNIITMTVNTNLPAGVSISTPTNPFCPGTVVTFMATPANGGTTPMFQWKVNSILSIPSILPILTYNPSNTDTVSCVMTSNLSCVTGNPASSAKIVMHGTLAPTVQFTACFDTVTTIDAKPFKLRGGLPLGGTYSGPGVNPMTGIFTPSAAGTGKKTITYSYTNNDGCTAAYSRSVAVRDASPVTCGSTMTDIRDGKTYPTVQIGTQCWMAANLDFGYWILDAVPQTDNCLSEKYVRALLPALRTSSFVLRTSFYQWDELMQYQTAEGSQGLCPPGWHVPTESEWATLSYFYQGSSKAGRPLQDSTANGFAAKSSGVFYSGASWNLMDFASIFWTSTPSGQEKAISHGMNAVNYSVSLYPAGRGNAFGARCLRDE